jgi:hypothetical protein
MKKLLLFCFTLFTALLNAQTVAIEGASTSGNVVVSTSNYNVWEAIYTDAEIGATNFTAAGTALTRIEFNLNTLPTVGGTTVASPNFKIYYREVPAATTTFAAAATYSTAGYTLVYNGAFSFSATGWNGVDLNIPILRTPGTNLQIMVERTDNVARTGIVWLSANVSLNNLRRYTGAAAISGTTSLALNMFRPAIRFIRPLANDAAVTNLYTLGKLPIPNGTPRTDSARVSNLGTSALTNLNVTLNITGANTFTNTKTVASLAPGASTFVVFDAYTSTNEGINNIAVSVPADENNTNNTVTVEQNVNKNTWSYAYGTTPTSGVGFNGVTGEFVAKFNTSIATALSQVSVNFFVAGQPYKISILDASGANGAPGATLYTSTSQTAAAGVNVIPVSPAIAIPAGDFYVGVIQLNTANVNFAYQRENNIRAKTFYARSPNNEAGTGGNWTDFAPANTFRFMIEPKLILANDASASDLVITTPAPNSCLSTSENVTVKINNPGLNMIPAGQATLTLKIRGANTFTGTASNTANIMSGASETITFTGVNLSNGGTNFDTAFVTFAGDLDISNDTVKNTIVTASTITNFPVLDNIEATVGLNVVNYLSIVNGARQLWTLQASNYSNPDQTNPLVPHSGTRMMLFDAYSGASSLNFVSRLYSNCLNIPAAAPGNCAQRLSFWMSHDNTTGLTTELDSLYVSISTDNGVTWTRVNIDGVAGLQRHDGSLTLNAAPVWRQSFVDLSAYAGQTIKIGFEGVSKYGNAFGLDDIEILSSGGAAVALTNGVSSLTLTEDCEGDGGWTYYKDGSNRNMLAIQWGSNAAAKAAASPSVTLEGSPYSATSGAGAGAEGTFVMARYWNVTTTVQPTTPVNLRFFYAAADKSAADAAALAFQSANTGSALEPPTWFKTVNSAFVPNATSTNAIGVNNAIPLTNTNTTNATINGVLYAQFNGITSFSGGGYAAGVGNNVVLPVNVASIKASITGATNTITWTTATESDNNKFVIERSTNGSTYASIGEVATKAILGNSNTALNYSFVDANPAQGKQFYRLQMVSNTGVKTFSQIVTLRRGAGKLEIADVRPNPTKGILYLNLLGADNNIVNLVVRALDGKQLISKNLVQSANLSVDLTALAAGMYLLEVTDIKTQEKAILKVVKN